MLLFSLQIYLSMFLKNSMYILNFVLYFFFKLEYASSVWRLHADILYFELIIWNYDQVTIIAASFYVILPFSLSISKLWGPWICFWMAHSTDNISTSSSSSFVAIHSLLTMWYWDVRATGNSSLVHFSIWWVRGFRFRLSYKKTALVCIKTALQASLV